MSENNDEIVLQRAREIAERDAIGLAAAMVRAESELAREAQGDENRITVTLDLKPKVAKWVRKIFGGHPRFTIEERLAAYIVSVLNRTRVQEMREFEEAPDLTKGNAVSMKRAQFMEKAGK